MHGPKIGSSDVMQCNFLFMTSHFYLPLGKSKLLPNDSEWLKGAQDRTKSSGVKYLNL